MTFDSTVLIALAPLVAALVGALALLAWRRRVSRAEAWSPALGAEARQSGRAGTLLLGLAALAGGVALAGPRGGRATVKAESNALSVVFAMDISRSMLAEDTRPSRLGRAVREARRLTRDLASDRIGLIAFAGRSYILSPLTLDGGAISLFLDALAPELASQGGTGLASALAQGADLLNASRESGDRVLVLFTDGEAHDSLPEVVARARALKDQQIRLVLVAEGMPRPVTIPLRDSTGAIIDYKTDEDGKPVETRRRDDVLQAVADAAEGALVPAELADQAGAVRDLLAAFQRAPSAESSTQDLVPLAWIPALIAALLLGLQTATRRSAALVGLAAMVLAAPGQAQRPAAGEREFQTGRLPEAVARLGRSLGPKASDTAYYNAGTALLALGDLPAARTAFDRAARSLDPALRYRALYNGGVAALTLAARDSTRRDSLLGAAADQLKQALTLMPSSARAKWNLELAQRHRPPPSGGGGASPNTPPPRGQQPPDPSAGRGGGAGSSGLSPSQAEQILNSVAREELDTRSRRMGRPRPAPSGVKDW